MAVLVEHGMLLQSAKGPLPNVAELVAGEPIKGSWWGHPRSHQIFDTLAELDDSPDVVRLRLVKGKVTLVHRRLWPALTRVSDRFAPAQLAALYEDTPRRVRTESMNRRSLNGSPTTRCEPPTICRPTTPGRCCRPVSAQLWRD